MLKSPVLWAAALFTMTNASTAQAGLFDWIFDKIDNFTGQPAGSAPELGLPLMGVAIGAACLLSARKLRRRSRD